ncbi:SIMPL domain-containing protein [Puniceibacterium sp. IMCC21224]|uniref:SIMPL domain-containing protein n=1 Tax=Puniceibacterium sp. IMCC21224 TaxID=1618204 RepID=UPI00064DB1A4|nr:SIMPL domain-containing protein [Puniceibacterium sp. IMCC21224]KMK67751.1 hypothetical protein IMCC21224_112625 [Puniceibacterium sp. IMCC21224]
MRRLSIAPVLPLFLLFAAPLAAQDAATPRIQVSGEGQVSAAPDMATITLGVSAQADTAAAAMDMTSGATQKILGRLEGFEITGGDVQTMDLSLNPVWNNRATSQDAPEITGFSASNQVMVRVRDLPKLGEILGAVLSDGANTLNGLNFGLQDPGPLLAQARAKAVKDAMARAGIYADAAGLTLGPVLSISEGGTAVPRPEMMMSMRAADVPVAQGETGISASVSMVFSIGE